MPPLVVAVRMEFATSAAGAARVAVPSPLAMRRPCARALPTGLVPLLNETAECGRAWGRQKTGTHNGTAPMSGCSLWTVSEIMRPSFRTNRTKEPVSKRRSDKKEWPP